MLLWGSGDTVRPPGTSLSPLERLPDITNSYLEFWWSPRSWRRFPQPVGVQVQAQDCGGRPPGSPYPHGQPSRSFGPHTIVLHLYRTPAGGGESLTTEEPQGLQILVRRVREPSYGAGGDPRRPQGVPRAPQKLFVAECTIYW